MRCAKCGAELDGRFCRGCGAENQFTMPNDPEPKAKKKKPFFLRWWFILLAVIVVLIIIPAPKEDEEKGNEIPDVFGIEYTDAIEVLKSEGFEVKAMETSVEGISDKLLYPLESVKKGIVFKVDEYILDGNGNLNKNYDVFYDGKALSDDKSVVIYYAKENYIFKEKAVDENNEEEKESSTEEVVEESSKPTSSDVSSKEIISSATEESGLSADFKSAMDSYEAFIDEYVAFMKKYADNPTDMGLISDYADYLEKYTNLVSEFEKWEDEDLTAEELAYYIEVQGRVSKKMIDVIQ